MRFLFVIGFLLTSTLAVAGGPEDDEKFIGLLECLFKQGVLDVSELSALAQPEIRFEGNWVANPICKGKVAPGSKKAEAAQVIDKYIQVLAPSPKAISQWAQSKLKEVPEHLVACAIDVLKGLDSEIDEQEVRDHLASLQTNQALSEFLPLTLPNWARPRWIHVEKSHPGLGFPFSIEVRREPRGIRAIFDDNAADANRNNLHLAANRFSSIDQHVPHGRAQRIHVVDALLLANSKRLRDVIAHRVPVNLGDLEIELVLTEMGDGPWAAAAASAWRPIGERCGITTIGDLRFLLKADFDHLLQNEVASPVLVILLKILLGEPLSRDLVTSFYNLLLFGEARNVPALPEAVDPTDMVVVDLLILAKSPRLRNLLNTLNHGRHEARVYRDGAVADAELCDAGSEGLVGFRDLQIAVVLPEMVEGQRSLAALNEWTHIVGLGCDITSVAELRLMSESGMHDFLARVSPELRTLLQILYGNTPIDLRALNRLFTAPSVVANNNND